RVRGWTCGHTIIRVGVWATRLARFVACAAAVDEGRALIHHCKPDARELPPLSITHSGQFLHWNGSDRFPRRGKHVPFSSPAMRVVTHRDVAVSRSRDGDVASGLQRLSEVHGSEEVPG